MNEYEYEWSCGNDIKGDGIKTEKRWSNVVMDLR